MLTVLEILRRTEAFFREKGVPDPRLDAERLIGHALKKKRLELYLEFDRPLEERALEQLRTLVRRRAAREPWQHLVGTMEFDGVFLKVDRRALIPRPETEELPEKIQTRLAQSPVEHILDLGTGTGALALALARRYPAATVTGVDLSADALALAAENTAANPSVTAPDWVESSWFEKLPAPAERVYDVIASNPPYLTETEFEDAQPEVRKHDPRLALAAGNDGLAAYRAIIPAALTYAKPGGLIALEIGSSQADAVTALLQKSGWTAVEVEADLQGRDRFVFAIAPAAE